MGVRLEDMNQSHERRTLFWIGNLNVWTTIAPSDVVYIIAKLATLCVVYPLFHWLAGI